jgi:hypothetical protein
LPPTDRSRHYTGPLDDTVDPHYKALRRRAGVALSEQHADDRRNIKDQPRANFATGHVEVQAAGTDRDGDARAAIAVANAAYVLDGAATHTRRRRRHGDFTAGPLTKGFV